MRGLSTTFRRRALWMVCALAGVSALGAGVGLSAVGAQTRSGASRTTARGSATSPSITTQSTPSPTTTGQATTGPSATTTSQSSTTTTASTTPTPAALGCQSCTPVINIGAVTRPLLGFGYGGRRYPTGGLELVAVVITGDDNPALSRVIIQLPGQLSQDLPAAQRHLIRAAPGHIRYTAHALIVTVPRHTTAETVRIPAAALATALSARARFAVDVAFQVRQGRATRRIGSRVTLG